jgi:hypothetical protein
MWLEVVGNRGYPACSVVAVRYRADHWVTPGMVTCVVGNREYKLIPSGSAFWDGEEAGAKNYVTLTFTSFSSPETREAFAAMIGQEAPVLIRMQGGNLIVEFTMDEAELRWLRETLTIYRACGGPWPVEEIS